MPGKKYIGFEDLAEPDPLALPLSKNTGGVRVNNLSIVKLTDVSPLLNTPSGCQSYTPPL